MIAGIYVVAVAVAIVAFYALLELFSWALGFPEVGELCRLVRENLRRWRQERALDRMRAASGLDVVEQVKESWQ